MYSVSNDFKTKIKENVRTFKLQITIQHSTGTLTLYDEDIAENTLYVDEKSIANDEFVAGGVIAKELGFTLIRKPEYDSIDFVGAKVLPQVGLLMAEGYDEYTTFLNPNQPSYYPEMLDLFEFVPLGSFNIDEINILTNTLEIKAVDNMIKLDQPYSLSSLSYPTTLENIYLEICTFADVAPATLSFTNDDYVVTTKITENATYRDLLAWVCELSGTFAYINKTNGLELRWYTPSGETYDGNHRFSIKVKNYDVNVTGVQYETDEAIYLAGTDDYVWNLSSNPLLQDNYATVLNNILTKVSALTYRPYATDWQGNPAMEVGDIITHNTTDGNIYTTIITHHKYKYRGKSVMEGNGLPQETQGFKGSTDKRIELVRKQLEETIGNEVSDLEQAIIDATDLLTAELGGYVIKRQNELLIMDTTDVETAQKVWRWNLNGLGYSSTGVNGTYGTAITMNGAIVANYITTGTLSANRVRTGLLSSVAGNSYFDLDNGIVRVSHGGTEYSQMDVNGFKRQWTYGSANYLNDIYSVVSLASGTTYSSPPPDVTVTLPSRFRNRDVEVIVIPTEYYSGLMNSIGSDGIWNYYFRTQEMVCHVSYTNMSAPTPYIDVTAYFTYERTDLDSNGLPYGDEQRYRGLSFDILVIGK